MTPPATQWVRCVLCANVMHHPIYSKQNIQDDQSDAAITRPLSSSHVRANTKSIKIVCSELCTDDYYALPCRKIRYFRFVHVSLSPSPLLAAFDRIEFRVIHHCHNAISVIISISSDKCQSPLCTHVMRRSMKSITTQPAPNIRCVVASIRSQPNIFHSENTMIAENKT